ncbi:MAG: hypothetical protein E6J41_24810 [Chloroflexi bacterium]|nr:MAG: hypothetical protein E6J41_24810 [Chloroflexota bacterium]
MFGKLAIFAVGYMLGARSGRERYEQLVGLARWVAGREEVQSAFGLAQSALQAASERTQERPRGRRRAA